MIWFALSLTNFWVRKGGKKRRRKEGKDLQEYCRRCNPLGAQGGVSLGRGTQAPPRGISSLRWLHLGTFAERGREGGEGWRERRKERSSEDSDDVRCRAFYFLISPLCIGESSVD